MWIKPLVCKFGSDQVCRIYHTHKSLVVSECPFDTASAAGPENPGFENKIIFVKGKRVVHWIPTPLASLPKAQKDIVDVETTIL